MTSGSTLTLPTEILVKRLFKHTAILSDSLWLLVVLAPGGKLVILDLSPFNKGEGDARSREIAALGFDVAAPLVAEVEARHRHHGQTVVAVAPVVGELGL